MPATVFHAFTNPAIDGTNSSVVRPSDWNSGHVVSLAPTGQEMIGGFSNAGNVTFATNVAGAIVASVAISTAYIPLADASSFAPVSHTHNYAATDVTSNAIPLASSSNFASASHAHAYAATDVTSNAIPLAQSSLFQQTSNTSAITSNAFPSANSSNLVATSQSSLLQHTSATSAITANAFPSANTTKFAGTGTSATNASITVNSNGIAISIAPGGGAGDGYNILAAGTQTAGSAGSVAFVNSNGISFGMSNSSQITASYTVPSQTVQPVAASAANGSFAFSTLTLANSNGVSFSTGTQGIYATVATNYAATNVTTNNLATSQSSLFQHTSATSAVTSLAMNTSERGNYFYTSNNTFANNTHSHGAVAATNISATSASNGLSLSVAAQTVQPVAVSGANGSFAFSTLTLANSNGVSFSTGTQGVYATVATNYAVSNITTNNLATSQSSLFQHTSATTAIVSDRAYNTHSHGNPTLALTNLSGTTASASNGLTISLSAAAPGGGGAINVSAGTTSGDLQTIQFNNANGVSFGLNGSTVTASHNAITTGALSDHSHGVTLALTNLSGTTGGNSDGITISLSGPAAGGGGGAPDRYFKEIIQGERLTTIVGLSATNVSNRPLLLPFWMEGTGIAANTARCLMSFGASSNRSLGGTFHCGLYSLQNSTQMTLLTSNSFSVSSTATASSASWNGVGWVDFGLGGFTCTAEGRYMLALQVNPVSANVTWMPVSLYGADNMPVQSRVWVNGATQAMSSNSQFIPFWGAYSTTTAALPNSIGLTQINGASSQFQFQYYAALKEV